MLEQLDLVGRTGELARAFGIDFFSVLTRGSQYRVESLLVRLAHSQNYLMLSPSREQVGLPALPPWACLRTHTTGQPVFDSHLQILSRGPAVLKMSHMIGCSKVGRHW